MTAPSIPDNLRARLLKTLELARRGEGGEKTNAEAMLEKLLRKHNLTLADLEELEKPALEWLWVEGADEAAGTILIGIFLLVCGAKVPVCNRSYIEKGEEVVDPSWVGAQVSAAQRAAITVLWDVYGRAWERATKDLAWAFVRKHALVPADAANLPRPTPPPFFSKEWLEAVEAQRRIGGFAQLLESVSRPTPRLSNGERKP